MSDGMSESEAVSSLQGHGFLPTSSESLKRLQSLVERETTAWQPNDGDVIVGTLRDVTDSAEGDYGSYPIVLIETEDKQLVTVHAFHTILRREIERKLQRGTLKLGDEIAILYVGKLPGKGGREPANNYRVAVNPVGR